MRRKLSREEGGDASRRKEKPPKHKFLTKERQIIFSSLVVSFSLVCLVFSLAGKGFSIFFSKNNHSLRTNIFNLLQPIQGLESFSSSSSLETNAEFEYMLSMISSQTKSVELSGGKVCTSSVEGTCRGGSNILDKDKNTRWSSLWKNNQYVSFRVPEQDLCASISQIGIIWETASATEYAIEISTDGTNWTEIGHYKAERKNWKVHTDLISLPYPICCVPLWRINCISRATKYGFSIYEIVLIKSKATISKP